VQKLHTWYPTHRPYVIDTGGDNPMSNGRPSPVVWVGEYA
jgi:hypothetical protein